VPYRLHGRHKRLEGDSPGKVLGSDSHPNGVATVRQWRRFGAAVFLDDGGFRWMAGVRGGSYGFGGRRGLGAVQPRKRRRCPFKGVSQQG
jgi:hypothetical protein